MATKDALIVFAGIFLLFGAIALLVWRDYRDGNIAKIGTAQPRRDSKQIPKTVTKDIKGGSETLLGCLVLIALPFGVWFVVGSVVGLFVVKTNPAEADIRETSRAREVIAQKFALDFLESEVRLDLLGGRNLEAWIPRKTFEMMPYPDRKEFVSNIGKTWCQTANPLIFPTLTIRDRTKGTKLATYSCVLSSTNLEPNE
jgi:hypothetical protein